MPFSLSSHLPWRELCYSINPSITITVLIPNRTSRGYTRSPSKMTISSTSVMADSDFESSVATSLMVANAKRDNLRQTLEAVRSHSSSLLLFSLQWKDLEEYFDSVSDAIAKRMEETELKSQQIEWRRKYLNQKSREIELKEKRLEERLKMADDRCREIDVTYELVGQCYRVVKRREKCCDGEWDRICKRKRLREYKRYLKRKFEKDELKLEARELRADNLEHELQVRNYKLGAIERKLLQKLEEAELREKRLDERASELERREKMLKVKLKDCSLRVGNGVKVKIESLGECDDNDGTWVDPSYADIKINVNMDGRALQMFLNGRVNDHDILRDEIIAGLRLSSDPAKLVLDAILGFYPEELQNGNVGFDVIVVRKSCILLLQQLIKMKLRIKTHVRERAMRVAMQWKEKMKVGDVYHYLEVVGFLQLVATYELTNVFNKDELLLLFESCACHDQAPDLCRSLGLTDTVHGVIQNLIIRDQPFKAIRLIYAFELVDIFPPVPILKAHLASTIVHVEKMCKNGDFSIEAQIECISLKLAVLFSVIKCIKEYGLECNYPVQPLEQLISELKMQKWKYKASSPTSMAQEESDVEELCMTSTSILLSSNDTTSLPLVEHLPAPASLVATQICSDSSGLKSPSSSATDIEPLTEDWSAPATPAGTQICSESTCLESAPSSATDAEPLTSTISNDSCSPISCRNSICPVAAPTMINPKSALNPQHKSEIGSPYRSKICRKSMNKNVKNKRPRLASARDSGSIIEPVNPHWVTYASARPMYMISTRSFGGYHVQRYYPYC